MPLPEYDNAAKWGNWLRGLPWWIKVLLGIAVTASTTFFIYERFGPVRALQKENQRLLSEFKQSESDVVALRDRKDELHRENLHLRELIDPIQKKAELLYPELETVAAIARLAEDLQDVRSLATRDVYKPLAQDQKDRMVAALREIRSQSATTNMNVTVTVQQGSSSRARVADDLIRYLNEAGWKAEINSIMAFYSGTPADISITMHPDDMTIAQQFAQIIGGVFINKQFAGHKIDNSARGHLEITINGDPLFSDSGVVTFR